MAEARRLGKEGKMRCDLELAWDLEADRAGSRLVGIAGKHDDLDDIRSSL